MQQLRFEASDNLSGKNDEALLFIVFRMVMMMLMRKEKDLEQLGISGEEVSKAVNDPIQDSEIQ
jgi:hypothetical protein